MKSNSLPNVKILDQFKLKAYEDDTFNVAAKLKFVLRRVADIVGGKTAGYQHFLLFFQEASFLRSLKVGIFW